MNWVSIQGIEVQCIIGVTERERAQTQRLEIDLQLHFDFTDARRSDSIADTVDYRLVRRRAVEACEKSSFQLIEALAGHLSEVILGDFPRISAVRVEVYKPRGLTGARTVGAVIVTAKPGHEGASP